MQLYGQIGEHNFHRVKGQNAAAALLREVGLGAAQTQIDFFTVVTDLGAADGALAGVVGEVTRPVLLLHQEGIAGILNMGGTDAHRPL